VVLLEGEVDCALKGRLIFRVVHSLQEGVLEGVIYCDSPAGVQVEHLVKKVECICGSSGEQLGQWDLILDGQTLDVLEGILVRDLRLGLVIRCPSHTDYQVNLLDVVLPRE